MQAKSLYMRPHENIVNSTSADLSTGKEAHKSVSGDTPSSGHHAVLLVRRLNVARRGLDLVQHVLEDGLHRRVVFGRSFKKGGLPRVRQLLPFFGADGPTRVLQVQFVAHQHQRHAGLADVFHNLVVYRLYDFESLSVVDGVHENVSVDVQRAAAREQRILLLSGSVDHLQIERLALELELLAM